MEKACPILIREPDGMKQILVFEHPLAGIQLVKGSIEPDETIENACKRELFEESGIVSEVSKDLGSWESGYENQIWEFRLMHIDFSLPETWLHKAADDGGHIFRFYWHPLIEEPSGNWHLLFIDALREIRKRVL